MTEATPQQRKKILVVSAHPEPRSLNTALAAFAVEELRAAGHEVQVSDLYAMKWKAAVDSDDFPDHAVDRRLDVLAVQGQATLAGRLSPDIAAEQEKVRWSDAVILQFPMWWFSVPAILKGWIDRVFSNGWAYDFDGESTRKKLGRLRVHLVALAGSDARTYERHGYGSAMKTQIDHGIFDYCGATVEGSALLLESESSDPAVQLQAALELGRGLFR